MAEITVTMGDDDTTEAICEWIEKHYGMEADPDTLEHQGDLTFLITVKAKALSESATTSEDGR